MITKQKTNLISLSKTEALELGIANRSRFLEVVQKLPMINEDDRYPHKFIFGYPGIGKTYEIQNYLDTTNTKYILINGNISMFAFGVQLAVINYLNKLNEKVLIFCDDVDALIATDTSCNILKSALHGPKMFSYEKSLMSQWHNLTELQKEAIKYHQADGKMGFQVPTNNMSFLLVSNIKLPTDDEVRYAREKGSVKAALLAHKNAIRSRCMVLDFCLNDAELWGWIADVILNTNCLSQYNMTDDEKVTILDFIWDNWPTLTERSIRLIEKMAIIKREYEQSFEAKWKIDFLN
jgi:hypothetical protein